MWIEECEYLAFCNFGGCESDVIGLLEAALVGSLFSLRMAMILHSFQIWGMLECW